MDCFEKKIELDYDGLQLGAGKHATLTCYLPSNWPEFSAGRLRPAVLVIPGGAYHMVSQREAEPVALQYVAADMAAFVLDYSVAEDAGFPRCLYEALTAVRMIRSNSAQWHINPDQIVVLGFSAGGHLAASASAFWNADFAIKALGDAAQMKPNAAVLCYPVISGGSYAHRGSFQNLLKETTTDARLELVSIENQVTDSFPPSFIWHTGTDGAVPVQNSLLLAKALADRHILFEMHIYPTGVHGLSLSDARTTGLDKEGQLKTKMCEIRPRQWVADSISFLKDTLFTK